MTTRLTTGLMMFAVLAACGAPAQDSGAPQPAGAASSWEATETEKRLYAGRLAEAWKELAGAQAPGAKDQTRFEAAIVRFLMGVEELAQGLHRYGHRTPPVPMLLDGGRLPIPERGDPEEINYEKFREVVERWDAALQETSALLTAMGDDAVKVHLRFGLVRLDLDGDGQGSDKEALYRIFAAFNQMAMPSESEAGEFVIAFDRADAEWLRGYCNLLMGANDFLLAHDFRELFERTGHLFFARVASPYSFLAGRASPTDWDYDEILDLIAYVHLINFEVKSPERMRDALAHLKEMTAASRRMWRLAMAETDDEREWIPNPKQTGVVPNAEVTPELIAGWHEFLDELDALLTGKKLLPFWRDAGGKGVNLSRAFSEPRRLDLVLWVQGTAAAPYLEEGPVTQAEFWERLHRLFRGEFIGFAFWWN